MDNAISFDRPDEPQSYGGRLEGMVEDYVTDASRQQELDMFVCSDQFVIALCRMRSDLVYRTISLLTLVWIQVGFDIARRSCLSNPDRRRRTRVMTASSRQAQGFSQVAQNTGRWFTIQNSPTICPSASRGRYNDMPIKHVP